MVIVKKRQRGNRRSPALSGVSGSEAERPVVEVDRPTRATDREPGQIVRCIETTDCNQASYSPGATAPFDGGIR